jgi:hypothetical protein
VSEKSVFSSLRKLSPRAFTETAYQVSILLRHRRMLKSTKANQVLEPVRVNGLVKTNSSLKQRLNKSVRQIEKAEGRSLYQIPDAKILKYQQELSGLIFQKARDASGPARASGEVVLDRLRAVDSPKIVGKYESPSTHEVSGLGFRRVRSNRSIPAPSAASSRRSMKSLTGGKKAVDNAEGGKVRYAAKSASAVAKPRSTGITKRTLAKNRLPVERGTSSM